MCVDRYLRRTHQFIVVDWMSAPSVAEGGQDVLAIGVQGEVELGFGSYGVEFADDTLRLGLVGAGGALEDVAAWARGGTTST